MSVCPECERTRAHMDADPELYRGESRLCLAHYVRMVERRQGLRRGKKKTAAHTEAVVNVARMLDNWWRACGVHQEPEDIGPELAAHADAISAAVQRLDR